MRPPRGLSPEEAALWRRVAETVAPLDPPRIAEADRPQAGGGDLPPAARPPAPEAAKSRPAAASPPPPLRDGSPPRSKDGAGDRRGLDASWERRLARGLVEPDFTLDLHGHTLDAAHARLDRGLTQARATGARLVLLVTGRPRPVDAADRAQRRGAIRAKVGDWLAAGEHAHDVAAIRTAHRRHGGAGALYLVLRRRR